MKRVFILLAVFAIGLIAKAQDVIVTHDAVRIDAIIEEVSETQVKYKKADNPNGPSFIMNTDKIATIIYQNGSVQTFEQQQSQNATPTLHDIARIHAEQENGDRHIPTPSEGPWLVWGVQVKEGFNVYFTSEYKDYSTNTRYVPVVGMRYLPSIEGYVEFAPKQEDMGFKRHAIYMGLQYTFRGGQILEGVNGNPLLDLQYLCFRPAYSAEHKVFYSRTGVELGVLTYSATKYGSTKYNVRDDCNKVTFGIWEEMGWFIKDIFNIGMSFDFIMTNSTSTLWGHQNQNGSWTTHVRYSPQLQFQIVFGWRFNPYKFDKGRVEPVAL